MSALRLDGARGDKRIDMAREWIADLSCVPVFEKIAEDEARLELATDQIGQRMTEFGGLQLAEDACGKLVGVQAGAIGVRDCMANDKRATIFVEEVTERIDEAS